MKSPWDVILGTPSTMISPLSSTPFTASNGTEMIGSSSATFRQVSWTQNILTVVREIFCILQPLKTNPDKCEYERQQLITIVYTANIHNNIYTCFLHKYVPYKIPGETYSIFAIQNFGA